MKQDKRIYAGMLLVSTLLGAAGQISFKTGVTSDLQGLVAGVALGLLAYFTSTIIYFYVLSRTHLSWAYGFGGLAYVFTSLIAFFVLNETVPVLRWAGIGIVAIGTLLIGTS